MKQTAAQAMASEKRAATEEAESLYALVTSGQETVEAMRALIGMTPRVRRVLLAANDYVGRQLIARALRFRSMTSDAFEALVAA